jgi:hypothetical protein
MIGANVGRDAALRAVRFARGCFDTPSALTRLAGSA